MVTIDKDFLMQIYLETIPNYNVKTYTQEVIWSALEFFLEEAKNINLTEFSLPITLKLSKFKPAKDDEKSLRLYKEILEGMKRKI